MFTNSDGVVCDDNKCEKCIFSSKEGCRRPSFMKCWKNKKEGNNG